MPTKDTFDYIFNIAIASVNNYVSDRRRAKWFCDKLVSKKNKIRDTYILLRDAIKDRYMKQPDELLDRHKCAAAFMVTVIDCIDIEENNHNKEKFGIFIGLTLLKIFIQKECRIFGSMKLVDFINRHGGLQYPPCVCDKSTYRHNWATELYCARKEERLFVLSISNNLFMIETYNRQCAQIEGLASELKRN